MLGWLTKLTVGIALVGLLLFDAISVGSTAATIADQGSYAAHEAAATWDSTHDLQETYLTAAAKAAEQNPENVVSTKDFTVDPDGTVHLVISREAPTLILFRWDRTAKWAARRSAASATGPHRRPDCRLAPSPGLTAGTAGRRTYDGLACRCRRATAFIEGVLCRPTPSSRALGSSTAIASRSTSARRTGRRTGGPRTSCSTDRSASACCRRPTATPDACCVPRAARPSSPTPGSCGCWTPARSTVSSTSSASGSAPPTSSTCSPTGRCTPGEARQLGIDVAEALTAAHQAGLAHLCLQPEHVLRTTHGQVKVGGLAVDAAVRGVEYAGEADAARRDTWGAAAIAYAALTARWPDGAGTGLPVAPRDGAALCSPRQVRAGVPHDLDTIVCRALDIPVPHDQPLHDPVELARALTAVQVTSRVPVIRRADGDEPTPPSYRPSHLSPYDDQATRPRSRAAVLAWAAVSLVLVVGFALAGWQLVMSALDGNGAAGDEQTPAQSSSASSTAAPTGTKLRVRDVVSFDPPPDGTGEENGDRAGRAIDGDRSTVWTSKSYDDPFGPSGIKDGVGLVLDLGSTTKVGSVTVWTAGGTTDLEVRAAGQLGSSLDDFEPVAKAVDVDGRAVLRPTETAASALPAGLAHVGTGR